MTAKRVNSHKILAVLGLCMFSVVCAQAQTWTVREYGGDEAWTSEDGEPHPFVTVYGDPYYRITITTDPDRELKFEIYYAEANGDYIEAAPLNDFTIAGAVDAELIEICILGDPEAEDPEHEFGASNIAQMNILPGNFDECRLTGLKISGNIATMGDVDCDSITGTVDIGGNIGQLSGGAPQTTFKVGTATFPIIVRGTIIAYDELEGGTLGDLTVYGSGITPVQGDITITNSYAGTLFIDHRFDGDLTIGDPNDPNDPNDPYVVSHLTGEVNIAGIRMGKTVVTGNVASGALIAGR